MQKGQFLEFKCTSCKTPVAFSIFDFSIEKEHITCNCCNKIYVFTDEKLVRQLKKFELLCKQIVDSEEILSNTSVGIDVGEHHIKIPYKLLLTRLNSCLELKIGSESIYIDFRFEPLTQTNRE